MFWTGFKLQEEQRVCQKTVGNCGCNYYCGGCEKLPTYALQTGLKSVTGAGNVKITSPPPDK